MVDDLDVVSLAVNGQRVDVVARGGGRVWRVVFGTSDGATAEWVSVYERPTVFNGVVGGRAIVVNGPSSSGKSTVLRAIRSMSSLPWVVFDEPMFGAVNVEYLIWRDTAEGLHRGFLAGIAALAGAGNLVAVAAGGHPASMFDEAFEGVPTVRIGLDCNPEELERRESLRDDVPGGMARDSPTIHEGWHYDLRFETASTSPDEIAAAALQQSTD
jgi:chloramphenicol 3-O phosphotransferase